MLKYSAALKRNMEDRIKKHSDSEKHRVVSTFLPRANFYYSRDPKKTALIKEVARGNSDTYHIGIRKEHRRDHDVITYEYEKPKRPNLETFIGAVTEMMVFYDTFDPYSREPTKYVDEKIDGFLKSHLGIDYKQFIREVDLESITENDYGLLAKRGLKKKLFDYRAKVYLFAFSRAEEKGFDLKDLLEEVSNLRILPIKKHEKEPTFIYIKERLTKKN